MKAWRQKTGLKGLRRPWGVKPSCKLEPDSRKVASSALPLLSNHDLFPRESRRLVRSSADKAAINFQRGWVLFIYVTAMSVGVGRSEENLHSSLT